VQKIYCLSGLGADERVFHRLHIDGCELVHISWIPFTQNETLKTYAAKLAAVIRDKEPVVLGMSFGGMLATEIAKILPVKKTFLISSAKTRTELPQYNGLLRMLLSAQLIPASFFQWPNPVIYYLFGAKTREEKKMLKDVLKHTNGKLVTWALKAIMQWNNSKVPGNIVHIHGTNDKILPGKFVKADYWIEDGSHIMIYNRAEEVSNIIEKELAKDQ
jgi:pimeloyl-ACP methyl ester carboxylesterase